MQTVEGLWGCGTPASRANHWSVWKEQAAGFQICADSFCFSPSGLSGFAAHRASTAKHSLEAWELQFLGWFSSLFAKANSHSHQAVIHPSWLPRDNPHRSWLVDGSCRKVEHSWLHQSPKARQAYPGTPALGDPRKPPLGLVSGAIQSHVQPSVTSCGRCCCFPFSFLLDLESRGPVALR